MKMKSYLWLLALCVILVVQSCSDDDETITPQPEEDVLVGVLVANEGGFMTASGTVTYFNPETDSVAQNIYRNLAGQYAGHVLQSITIADDRAYLVMNAGNVIEVADANTFARIGMIQNDKLSMPRYMQVINGKGYISMWGDYAASGVEGSVIQVVNLETFQLEEEIDTPEGTEALAYNGRYLFASNDNLGIGTSVSVIDPTTNDIVTNIEVGVGPKGMVIDADGKLWVVTTGNYNATESHLYRVNTTTFAVEQDIALDYRANEDLAISTDGRSVLYTAGSDVYSLSVTATVAPEAPIVEASDMVVPYAFGVNPDNGDIYLGDALDYTSAGKVYVYNATGTLKTSFTAGISPGQFIFKK